MPKLDQRQQRQCQLLEKAVGNLIIDALQHPETVEVLLNPDGKIFVETIGKGMRHIGSLSREKALNTLTTVAGFHKREVTLTSPILECSWPLDGSRFAGQLPPIVNRPTFAIRKKATKVYSLAEYVAQGIMSEQQKAAVEEMVRRKYNILIVGGTGTGKTTLTNAVIKEIVDQSPEERIISIEDTPELQVSSENYVSYFTTVFTSMTDLLKASLRMRPNRILVGETRGPETLDLLMAWNTGHPGGAATLHADDALSGLYKMVEYISMNPSAPRNIEPLIGRAVDGIVWIGHTPQGRRIKEILSVQGFDPTTNRFQTTKQG